MRRREPGPPAELEALDPLTGESLTSSSSPGSSSARAVPVALASAARAQRRRRLARFLAVLALGCALAAGYFGATVAQLRGIERTWRTAVAVDDARARADEQVETTLTNLGGDELAARAALSAIGDEAAAHLTTAERVLADRRILDSKVSDLRDEMIEALRFRRFQLTPQRAEMGNTPLDRVDGSIDAQLDRWDLEPVEVAPPRLRSSAAIIAGLRRYTDVRTDAVVFVTVARRMFTLDLDASTARARTVDGPVVRLFPAPGGVAVHTGAEVIVYPPDVDEPPVVRVPASGPVFEVADGSHDLWVVEPGGVRRFRPAVGETLQGVVPTHPARRVVGGAAGRLVLERTDDGGLELWSPSAPTVVLTTTPARFLAGNRRSVLWQGPLPFGAPDSDGYVHLLDVETSERELMALPPTDAALGALSSQGDVAIVAGPLAGRIGSVLVAEAATVALTGTGGPRALVQQDALRWSDDGELLFWLDPDGRVVFRRGDGAPTTLRTGLESLRRLAVMGR